VTVNEMTSHIGSGLHSTRLNLIVERLASTGVRILKDTALTSVSGKRVEIKTADEKRTLDSIDFIVFAVGYRSNTRLAEEINKDIPTTVIGDAYRPGTIFEAIRDGFEAAAGL
jgi:NADH dehydrogenase FAD-containing subunit